MLFTTEQPDRLPRFPTQALCPNFPVQEEHASTSGRGTRDCLKAISALNTKRTSLISRHTDCLAIDFISDSPLTELSRGIPIGSIRGACSRHLYTMCRLYH